MTPTQLTAWTQCSSRLLLHSWTFFEKYISHNAFRHEKLVALPWLIQMFDFFQGLISDFLSKSHNWQQRSGDVSTILRCISINDCVTKHNREFESFAKLQHTINDWCHVTFKCRKNQRSCRGNSKVLLTLLWCCEWCRRQGETKWYELDKTITVDCCG